MKIWPSHAVDNILIVAIEFRRSLCVNAKDPELISQSVFTIFSISSAYIFLIKCSSINGVLLLAILGLQGTIHI